jgi:hemerythrin
MTVIWSDEKHSLALPEIDAQHQELFLIANRLAESGEAPDSPGRTQAVIASLKRLLAYCHYHFTTEEEALRLHGWDRLGDHAALHRAFTDRVRDFVAETRQSPNPRIYQVLDELVDWILVHIQREDRAYADWFAARGLAVRLHAGPSQQGASVPADSLSLWNENKLRLDIRAIDDQHRELVMILAQANDLLRANPQRQRAFLPGIIQKMYYYSQFHFSFEEELMSQHGWSGLAAHRREHAAFITRIIEFSEGYKRFQPELAREIVEFLRIWTIHHILEEDRKFKDALPAG